MYSYLAPLRNEVKTLTIETVKKPTGDFIWNKEDMVLVLNEIKQKHKRIELDIPKEFQNILKESFKLYPRKYLFTNVNAFPDITKQATINTLSTRLLKIYSKYGKNVGTNSLRSSYVSYFFKQAILKTGNPPSDTSVNELSIRMRTSSKMIYNNYRHNHLEYYL
jgi:integrase